MQLDVPFDSKLYGFSRSHYFVIQIQCKSKFKDTNKPAEQKISGKTHFSFPRHDHLENSWNFCLCAFNQIKVLAFLVLSDKVTIKLFRNLVKSSLWALKSF